MRTLFFIAVFFLFVSCEQTENCDLNYYPSPPYSNPDDTLFGNNQVRYLYVCWNDSGYNKATFTYVEFSGDCLGKLIVDEDPNFNCT